MLAEVLPRLSDCQKQLSDWAGYLSSCIKLLSLDPGVLSDEERRSLQSDILKNAHGGLKIPVSLDVSALLTFAARGGPPLELCEGDPGTLMVTVWSGLAEEITMDSLSLTLITTFSADEGTKVCKKLGIIMSSKMAIQVFYGTLHCSADVWTHVMGGGAALQSPA